MSCTKALSSRTMGRVGGVEVCWSSTREQIEAFAARNLEGERKRRRRVGVNQAEKTALGSDPYGILSPI